MKTYLTVMFNSEGEAPSKVSDTLMSMGFQPITGNYDYVYDWGTKANIKEIIWFGDKVQAALKGAKVLFKLETTTNKE
ncbi:MAG: hypothetical protein CVT47_02970 [Thermoplasmata archaeon HGW-Thermoplasmata-2]|nr:MAG: hypothetical protein CVT47_02970 [Thermoplasmata archaeon HGW-Thermoplasmata-2]